MISTRNPAAYRSDMESSSYWMKYETSTQDDEITVNFVAPTISKALENILSNPISFVEAKFENRNALALSCILVGDNKSASKRDSPHQESDSEAHDSGINNTNFHNSTAQNKRRKLNTVDEETSDSGYSSLGPSTDSLCRGSPHSQLLPRVHSEANGAQSTATTAEVKVKVDVSSPRVSFLSKGKDSETSPRTLSKESNQNSLSKSSRSHVDLSRGVKEVIISPESSRSHFRIEL